jgi:hypothetical protein
MLPVTVQLHDDLHRKLVEICAAKGRTPEDSLEEMLVGPIIDAYTFHIDAPDDYFFQQKPLTTAEADVAERAIVRPVMDSAENVNHRPEALIYGLMRAAYGQALALCTLKGWRHLPRSPMKLSTRDNKASRVLTTFPKLSVRGHIPDMLKSSERPTADNLS